MLKKIKDNILEKRKNFSDMTNLNVAAPQFSGDLLIYKEIRDGIILTKDGRYIKIFEIDPMNFILKDEDEQETTIAKFAKLLTSAPARMQFKVHSAKADIGHFIETLQKTLYDEDNIDILEMANDYAELIMRIGAEAAVQRRFFIIFQFEGSASSTEEGFEAVRIEMAKKERFLKSEFRTIGNGIAHTLAESVQVEELLYSLLNRKSLRTQNYSQRRKRMINDHRKINLLPETAKVSLPTCDLVAPRGADFTHKDYCVIDGIFYSYYYVKGDKIPALVTSGWLSYLIGYGDGYDIDIFTSRINKGSFEAELAQRLKFGTIKEGNRDVSSMDYESLTTYIEDMQILKSMLNKGEDPYHVSILVTVYADSVKELKAKETELIEDMASQLPFTPCQNLQMEGFKSSLAGVGINPAIEKRSKRNITTNSLASCYPFTAYELNSKNNGILFGVNAYNSSICSLNPFDTDMFKNANMCIFGTTGAGKTYSLLLLVLRLRLLGVQIFFISPDKQVEVIRPAKAIGGEFVDMSASGRQTINLLEIRPLTSPISELLEEGVAVEGSWLIEKVNQVKIFLSLLVPDLTYRQEQKLDGVILRMYEAFGITRENDSIYIDPEDKQLGIKKMPILGDLYEEMKNDIKIEEELTESLLPFVEGSANIFNGQTNVQLDNLFLVFGLEKLKDTPLMNPALFIALEFIWNEIKKDRVKKKLVVIDEGWQLIDGSNKKTAEFVKRLFKIIRGYGGGAVLATQQIRDLYAFDGGTYGNAIIENSKIKLLLQMEKKEAEHIKDVLNLSKEEVEAITSFGTGSGLLCANTNHVPIEIIGSSKEHHLITTKRADLEQIAKEKKEEKQSGQ